MDAGQLTLCLKCSDLAQARRFYEALGFEVLESREDSLVLKKGPTRLALMTFLPENCLNFRGADPFALHEALAAAGLDVAGEPERYAAQRYDASGDGCCWMTTDPDGNGVLIDTTDAEASAQGRRQRLQALLEDTARELASLDAPAECQRAFAQAVLEPFGRDST